MAFVSWHTLCFVQFIIIIPPFIINYFRRCVMSGNANGLSQWLRNNNPLYLLSVVLMLGGLYLAGSELETGRVSSLAVSGFFLVQNIYEIIMVAMALYLLKKKIQPQHGKLLLFFVLLFLGDLTFYQVRISGLSTAAGGIATGVYMLMAAVKFAAIVKILGLTVHHTRLFFAAGAFSLIWVAPKVSYYLVDSIGSESFSYFDGSYVFYSLWLIAALIHLPLIVENWHSNNLETEVPNEYLGNETALWRWLLIFPFIVLPLQMSATVMSDSYRFIAPTLSIGTIIAPWLLTAAFFAQTLWRRFFNDRESINIYDSAVMLVYLIIIKVSAPDFSAPVLINHALLVAGLVATWLTRCNHVNAGVLALTGLWHTGQQVMSGARVAVDYGSSLSGTAWAGILMSGSFILLLTGFFFSISRNSGDDSNNGETRPESTNSQETSV